MEDLRIADSHYRALRDAAYEGYADKFHVPLRKARTTIFPLGQELAEQLQEECPRTAHKYVSYYPLKGATTFQESGQQVDNAKCTIAHDFPGNPVIRFYIKFAIFCPDPTPAQSKAISYFKRILSNDAQYDQPHVPVSQHALDVLRL